MKVENDGYDCHHNFCYEHTIFKIPQAETQKRKITQITRQKRHIRTMHDHINNPMGKTQAGQNYFAATGFPKAVSNPVGHRCDGQCTDQRMGVKNIQGEVAVGTWFKALNAEGDKRRKQQIHKLRCQEQYPNRHRWSQFLGCYSKCEVTHKHFEYPCLFLNAHHLAVLSYNSSDTCRVNVEAVAGTMQHCVTSYTAVSLPISLEVPVMTAVWANLFILVQLARHSTV